MTSGTRSAGTGHVDTDEFARRVPEAVQLANIPSLIMVLVQLTGDLSWLDDPYRPQRAGGLGDNDSGGLAPEHAAEVRSATADALVAWRRGRPMALPDPPEALLVRMLAVAMGEEVPSEYGAMLADEARAAGRAPERLAVPDGAADFPSMPDEFDAVVIGAGAGGLCAAVNLAAAGVPFTVLERRHTVGGTWLDNAYPGAGVDTPNHLYSFSFAPHDWERYFCLRDELHGYLEDVSHRFGLRSRIRFGVEVLVAEYDEGACRWRVDYRDAEGGRHTLHAALVISAVGAFNPPALPDVAGLEEFEGDCYHSARWPDDASVEGRRVGIVGSGATAMQIVPEIAERAGHVTIFQRTPQWAAPFEQFRREVPEPVRFLLREVPLYRVWYRMRLGWTFNDRVHPALQKDPAWEHPERSVNAQNDAFRRFFTRYVESQLGAHADELRDAVLPTYPPYGKRILLDNGWYAAVCRDDVTLVPEAAAAVEGRRVRTASGAEHELDVLILATGFDVTRFVSTYDVRGRGGRALRERWGDDGRAYLGCAVPGFPNFFVLYGPNLQGGHGGSLMFFLEAQMSYVMGLMRGMVERSVAALEVRDEVFTEYNEHLDRLHESMIWTHPGMSTYYRNSRGRVVVPTPLRVVDFWERTRRPDLGEYHQELRGGVRQEPR